MRRFVHTLSLLLLPNLREGIHLRTSLAPRTQFSGLPGTGFRVEAGLLDELSNSFLVLRSRDPSSPVLDRLMRAHREQGEQAWHYSALRCAPATVFVRAPEGSAIRVEKRQLGEQELSV